MMALCATSALGQEAYKNYDIGSYRLPDITRNKLDFSLKSNGEFYDYTQSSNTSSIDGNFDATFNRYRNARTFRGTQEAIFRFSGSHNKDNDGEKRGSYNVVCPIITAAVFMATITRGCSSRRVAGPFSLITEINCPERRRIRQN